jgi:hypothetical protein
MLTPLMELLSSHIEVQLSSQLLRLDCVCRSDKGVAPRLHGFANQKQFRARSSAGQWR